MNEDNGLFDDPHHHMKLRRNTDPATSHMAARQILPHLGKVETWVVTCIHKSPGNTARELEAIHCPHSPRKLGRRLDALEGKGSLIRMGPRKCKLSGKMAHVWYPLGTSWVWILEHMMKSRDESRDDSARHRENLAMTADTRHEPYLRPWHSSSPGPSL